MRVGFIGLGSQGGPMARRIVEAGYPTTLWARRPETLEPFAGTAAQIAENARALALGAVGGNLIRQLEDELARVRAELEETRAEMSKTNARLPGDPRTSSPQDPGSQAATAPLAQGRPTPKSQLVRIVSSPSVWFALIGWGVAVLLLFRRQSS